MKSNGNLLAAVAASPPKMGQPSVGRHWKGTSRFVSRSPGNGFVKSPGSKLIRAAREKAAASRSKPLDKGESFDFNLIKIEDSGQVVFPNRKGELVEISPALLSKIFG